MIIRPLVFFPRVGIADPNNVGRRLRWGPTDPRAISRPPRHSDHAARFLPRNFVDVMDSLHVDNAHLSGCRQY